MKSNLFAEIKGQIKKLHYIVQLSRGFTLIELVVTIAIGAIILSLTSNLLLAGVKSLNVVEDKIESENSVIYALDYIEGEVNSADSIGVLGNGSFFIIKKDGNSFIYITYDNKDNSIVRKAFTTYDKVLNLTESAFTNRGGSNVISKDITGYVDNIDLKGRILSIKINSDKESRSRDIALRCAYEE